jgi:hypothetical protein
LAAWHARPESPWAARTLRTAARLGVEVALQSRARPRKAEKTRMSPFSLKDESVENAEELP